MGRRKSFDLQLATLRPDNQDLSVQRVYTPAKHARRFAAKGRHMKLFQRPCRAILCLVVVICLAGCTTLVPLSMTVGQAMQTQLEIGDEVRITRKDGSILEFTMDAVTDEGVSGDGNFVAWSDVQQLEVRQFSAGKTIGLVALVAGVAYAGIGVAAENSSIWE